MDREPEAARTPHFAPLADLDGKTVLITGGTGSFGTEFCKTVLARYRLHKLIVFSRDELKQFDMQTSAAFGPHARVMRYFIGDVRDADRLEMAFRGVDYVIHAAAMKQIPAAEYNPFECIHTNVLGAENVVRAAIRANVERVIALSTDKAASPINLYGASKLAADKIFVAARNVVGSDRPMFSVVRYGNVLGSRGSVVPFFRERIRQGAKALPITDPAMTRFWITLPQGVDFVLSCLAVAQGSEISVPKLPSMKVTDLARAMAPGLATEIVGIRPGEKLHEAMITEDDARNTLELPDRYIIARDIAAAGRYHDQQSPVPAGFRYSSDGNVWWLKDVEMRALLDALAA